MAADLAELEEGIKDCELRLFKAARFDGVADFFIHGGADRFVKVALRGVEIDGVDEDGFWRKLGGDLVLRAAEDEGPEAGAEEVAAFVVVFFFNRVLVVFAEALERSEETGHEEAEEGPDFAEVVFDRGAGEAEALVAFEFAGCFADFCGGVFNVLGLV